MTVAEATLSPMRTVMREDQMRRVSIDCALKVARGDSIDQDVADAGVRLVGADAGSDSLRCR